MTIAELTQKIQSSAKSRTHEERLRLLKAAHILEADGSVNRFFTTIHDAPPLKIGLSKRKIESPRKG